MRIDFISYSFEFIIWYIVLLVVSGSADKTIRESLLWCGVFLFSVV